jgi:hypothetical protein
MPREKIYKYTLPVTDSFTVDLPKNAKILSFGVQRNQAVLWATVDIENDTADKRIPHRFFFVPTGNPVPILATLMFYDGNLVFHLFAGWKE